MPLTPLERSQARAATARGNSDTEWFDELIHVAHFAFKWIVLTTVATVQPDRDRHQYRFHHRLVRADSLGDWLPVLNEALTGTAAQFAMPSAVALRKEINQKFSATSAHWQARAATSLYDALSIANQQPVAPGAKLSLQDWLTTFVALRNAIAPGHAAPTVDQRARMAPTLAASIDEVLNNASIFQLEWAYLFRNLSNKYRVTYLNSDPASSFDYLRRETTHKLPGGVYIFLDGPVHVPLIETDAALSDVFVPNGRFKDKGFESLSLITGVKRTQPAGEWLGSIGTLPTSHTQGFGALQPHANTLANLPPLPTRYIRRPALESELNAQIMNDRVSIVTLAGRGGIGKTSLALTACHAAAQTVRFDAIVWLSARDIDLLPDGPKEVQPQVFTEADVARAFAQVLAPQSHSHKDFDGRAYFESTLNTPGTTPMLIVLDNIETVRNSGDLFRWILDHVRLPHKILITTRHNTFNGDFKIEVGGMHRDEFNALIASEAASDPTRTLSTPDIDRIFDQSGGHPYIGKLLVGEYLQTGRSPAIQNIMAGNPDALLAALFERSFTNLSAGAQRLLLTIAGWGSPVPRLAAEAVLYASIENDLDVSSCVDEGLAFSLIEEHPPRSSESFLVVPSEARLFATRRLRSSYDGEQIKRDTQRLMKFGATNESMFAVGIRRNIESFFKGLQKDLKQDLKKDLKQKATLTAEDKRTAEYLCREYVDARPLYAFVIQQVDPQAALSQRMRYVEERPDAVEAWREIAESYQRTGDHAGELHALLAGAACSGARLDDVSTIVNQFNALLSLEGTIFVPENAELLALVMQPLMERAITDRRATAADCSRIAWLYLRLNDQGQATHWTREGLRIDPNNEYCRSLGRRLDIAG